MENEVKEKDQSAALTSLEEKEAAEEIVVIDEKTLDQAAGQLVNQIIAEKNVDKVKDLTYLFNINQNKKTIIRQTKLNELYDLITDQAIQRWTERPDEMSNQDIITGLKTVQDLVEKGQKHIDGVNEAPQPLIQINQQNNSVNIDNTMAKLNRDSRERVKNAVMSLLDSVKQTTQQTVIEEEEEDIPTIALQENEEDD